MFPGAKDREGGRKSRDGHSQEIQRQRSVTPDLTVTPSPEMTPPEMTRPELTPPDS